MTECWRRLALPVFFSGFFGISCLAQQADLPEEIPLRKKLSDNPIDYPEGEEMRTREVKPWALSGRCRAFSRVSEPTYAIHRAKGEVTGGVGLVICPGGGYVDVWLDWEGHNLALWLAERGITSLVLKYRTNERRPGSRDYMERIHDWETYLPAVVSDARESIRILRSKAGELNLDPQKIGIAGFSAGGNLAFSAAFDVRYWQGELRQAGHPNFVGLFYPWLWEGFEEVARKAPRTYPTFMFNGGQDRVTPAVDCLELYRIFLERDVPTELLIYAKGKHGFGMGDDAGKSAAGWKFSFVSWLEDQGFLIRE